MIQEFFFFAWTNLTHRKLRSWLTIIGVVIGIAAIVSLISLGQGFESAIVEQFGVLGADKIRVVPEGLTGPPAGVTGLTTDDLDVVGKTRGVDYAGSLLFTLSNMEYNNEEVTLFLKAIEGDLAQEDKIDISVSISEGRWFEDGEGGGAVVGSSFAEDLFEKKVRLKNKIEIEGEEFEVIGILEEVGEQAVDQIVYIEMEDARRLYEKDEEVNVVYAEVEEGEDLNVIAERVAKDLEKARGTDDFDILTPDLVLGQLGSILAIVQFILAGIAAISLLVGGIGIMNSMYTSVLERTKQIGLMKAVGASQTDILGIFVVESGFIGLVGGIMGIILGVSFAFAVELVARIAGFNYLNIEFLWQVYFFALLFAFVVGIISGVYPAFKAARLEPVEALRYE